MPVRRTFLVTREIPELVSGALRGEAVALRRLLGARRAGRIGLVLFVLGLLACCPPRWMPAVILAHLGLAVGGPFLALPRTRIAWLEYLRLSLWTTPPWLLAAALLRPLWPAWTLAGVAVAILLGHVMLLRGLRKGLV